jgi:hypothetical protein
MQQAQKDIALTILKNLRWTPEEGLGHGELSRKRWSAPPPPPCNAARARTRALRQRLLSSGYRCRQSADLCRCGSMRGVVQRAAYSTYSNAHWGACSKELEAPEDAKRLRVLDDDLEDDADMATPPPFPPRADMHAYAHSCARVHTHARAHTHAPHIRTMLPPTDPLTLCP